MKARVQQDGAVRVPAPRRQAGGDPPAIQRIAAALRLTVIALALVALPHAMPTAVADGFRDDFATDPSAREWTHHGDVSPAAWDASPQRLTVAWDSTAPNRFFLRTLGRELTRADDIRVRFRLGLEEIATLDPDATFPISIGLIRREDALTTHFFRGAGVNPTWGPRNLVEFAYFPASRSITPTLSATAVASNNLRWAMVNLFPFEIATGASLDVELQFHSVPQTLTLTITRDGVPWAHGTTSVPAAFGEFRVDAVSVTSYSGDHQPAGYGGHVKARGWIDDLEVEYTDPPDGPLTIATESRALRLSIPAPESWVPALQVTTDFSQWSAATETAVREASEWRWQLNPSDSAARFFRILWRRP